MQREIYISEKLLPAHLKISEEEGREIIRQKVTDIKAYFKKHGYRRAIIGLSGGIDSALSFALAARAIGAKNLFVARLPYGNLFQENLKEAEKIALCFGVDKKNIITVPITKAVDASWEKLRKIKDVDKKIRKGNIMARERMKVLFDLSSCLKAVVLGAENKTEYYLGYYTLGGDHVSGIEPIFDLWKTQVYQLASFFKEMPDFVLKKVPSAGLWKGQSDEGEIGAIYRDIDIILSGFFELDLTRAEIKKEFDIPLAEINLVLKRAGYARGKAGLPYILKDSLSLKGLLTRSRDYEEIDLRHTRIEKSKSRNEKAIENLVRKLIKKLKKKKLFLGIMESATGGGLSNAITNIPHASEILKGALVTYSNEEKIARGVPRSLIKKYSVYSPEVALVMARVARGKITRAGIGIGVTGIFSRLDPENPETPVGLLYTAIIFRKKILVRKFYFPEFARSTVKTLAIRKILEILNNL